MTYALVQHDKFTGTGANATPTLPSPTSPNNLVTIQARFLLAASAVSDPSGFSGTRDAVIDNGGASPCALIIGKVTAGSESSFAFTNAGGGGTWEIEISEWSGGAISSPKDAASAGNTGSAVATLPPGSLAPTVTSGELMLSIVTMSAGNGGESATGGGWTDQDQATFQFMNCAYKIKSDMAAENQAFNWTTPRNCWAIQVAYKELAVVTTTRQRSFPRGVDRGVSRGVA